MKRKEQGYWIVREETHPHSIIAIYPIEQFSEVSEIVEGPCRNHPNHFTVEKKKESDLTRAEVKEASRQWLKASLLGLIETVKKRNGTGRNEAIQSVLTDLIEISHWNDS